MNMNNTEDRELTTIERLEEMHHVVENMSHSMKYPMNGRNLSYEEENMEKGKSQIIMDLIEICLKQEKKIDRLEKVTHDILEKVAIQFDVVVDR